MPATVRPVSYEEASPEVRAVYDDFMKTRGLDFIPNFWQTIASHPPLLKRTWESLKEVMAPGALDPLVKEMIAVAVSATNGCEYCTRSHTMAARKQGMSDEMLGELISVVGMFNETNRLVEGYRVEPDDFMMNPPNS
ncbi:MAG: carboxymuconolactone decarboxylase family protein [Rhodospirillales bacterium]|nr:carboxymuconolactone decarboxylase family protein [Rhodospirillales bacterium]